MAFALRHKISTGLRWSLKYTGLESGLHPNDEDWHVWGKDDLRQSWGQYWKYKANMQDFQKLDKVMCVFSPSFKFVLLVNVQILSPFPRSQSLGNAAIQFWKK